MLNKINFEFMHAFRHWSGDRDECLVADFISRVCIDDVMRVIFFDLTG